MQLIKYNDTYYQSMLDYKINDTQLQFTKSPIENLQLAKNNSNRHCILGINNQNEVVVFFVLHEYCEFTKHFPTPSKSTIFVRSLSTDERHLRKGYARESLAQLDHFLSQQMPHIKHVALLVDKPNHIAYQLYMRLGFKDINIDVNHTGTIQTLMLKDL